MKMWQYFIPHLVNCSQSLVINLLAVSLYDGNEHTPVRASVR